MATKATRLVQFKVTPLVMRRIHALRKNYGITLKEMMTRAVSDMLARGAIPKTPG